MPHRPNISISDDGYVRVRECGVTVILSLETARAIAVELERWKRGGKRTEAKDDDFEAADTNVFRAGLRRVGER